MKRVVGQGKHLGPAWTETRAEGKKRTKKSNVLHPGRLRRELVDFSQFNDPFRARIDGRVRDYPA